jgi:hypothetical protein
MALRSMTGSSFSQSRTGSLPASFLKNLAPSVGILVSFVMAYGTNFGTGRKSCAIRVTRRDVRVGGSPRACGQQLLWKARPRFDPEFKN